MPWPAAPELGAGSSFCPLSDTPPTLSRSLPARKSNPRVGRTVLGPGPARFSGAAFNGNSSGRHSWHAPGMAFTVHRAEGTDEFDDDCIYQYLDNGMLKVTVMSRGSGATLHRTFSASGWLEVTADVDHGPGKGKGGRNQVTALR